MFKVVMEGNVISSNSLESATEKEIVHASQIEEGRISALAEISVFDFQTVTGPMFVLITRNSSHFQTSKGPVKLSWSKRTS